MRSDGLGTYCSVRMIALLSRCALATLIAAIVLAFLPIGGQAHTCTPDPEVGVSGRLLLPRGSGLFMIDLPDRNTRTIPLVPSVGVVSNVARSPDGSRFAVTRFWRPPEHQVGGQDILVVGTEGGEPIRKIERSRQGEVIGGPTWLPDGSLVVERQTVAGGLYSSRIERHTLDGSDGQLLAEQAWAPTVAPDGSTLVFVRSQGTDQLMTKPMSGGPERVLVDDPRFWSFAFPRFSPDGAWIAFSAVTDQSLAFGLPDEAHGFSGPFGLGARSAHAHGLPWDIWLVRPDGSDLRRATTFLDDDPSVAWSPDGRWLAVFSGEALHVVAVEGNEDYCITAEGGYGAFEWLP